MATKSIPEQWLLKLPLVRECSQIVWERILYSIKASWYYYTRLIGVLRTQWNTTVYSTITLTVWTKHNLKITQLIAQPLELNDFKEHQLQSLIGPRPGNDIRPHPPPVHWSWMSHSRKTFRGRSPHRRISTYCMYILYVNKEMSIILPLYLHTDYCSSQYWCPRHIITIKSGTAKGYHTLEY